MTPRENFLRFMQGEAPAWLPSEIPMTPPIEERLRKATGAKDLEDHFQTDFRLFGPNWPDVSAAYESAYRACGVPLPEPHEIVCYGITYALPDRESMGEAWHMKQFFHALADLTLDQIRNLPWPDLRDPRPYAHFKSTVEDIHARGLVAVGSLECTVFEHSWYLRGMDAFFADLADETGVAEFLMDWFTERSIAVSRAMVCAGADVIRLGDDIGMQHTMLMSASMWRENLKPRLARVIRALREEEQARGRKVWVFYHSDGDIRSVIPELIEVGVDILNPLQPECMPVKQIVETYKDRAAFWGIIGTQTTMPHGTTADVERSVDEVADLVRAGARIVVAPTHVLEPDVPDANVLAFHKAVQKTRSTLRPCTV